MKSTAATSDIQSARVSIVPLSSYEPSAVDDALSALLDPLGGVKEMIPTGAKVVLKPNLLLPREPKTAVCTHPEIIRSMARLVSHQQPRELVITDSPGIGTASRVARKLELNDEKLYAVHDATDGVELAPPGAEFHRLLVSQKMIEADVLINLAKAKTHGQMVITAAVKNTFGAVVGLEKAQWHYRAGRDPMAFARLLVHIHRLVAPKLNILDAVVGMEGNGPGSGDPRPLGFLAASTNAFALDAVLCSIWGISTDKVYALKAAAQAGVLPSEKQIEIIGPKIATLRPSPPWRLARPLPLRHLRGPAWVASLVDRLLALRPVVDQNACVACGKCAQACAARAMEINKSQATQRVSIDKQQCIACFCCQEICPEGAIRVSVGPMARLLGLGVRERD